MKALLSPAYQKLKNVPKVADEQEAQQLLLSIIPYAFFLRVERGAPTGTSSGSPKQLQITQMQTFVPSDYYAWFYEGSQWTTYVGGLAMVAIMLAGVMFPLWPPIMRLGVWYLSIGVLGLIGLFFALAIVRLIFYIITIIVAPPGIWIFPKLFADVGFVSHLPLGACNQARGAHEDVPTGRVVHSAMGVGRAQEEGQEEAVGERQGGQRWRRVARLLRAHRGSAGFRQLAACEPASTRRGGAGRGGVMTLCA